MFLLVVFFCNYIFAQPAQKNFPQNEINNLSKKAISNYPLHKQNSSKQKASSLNTHSIHRILELAENMKINPPSTNWIQNGDTIIVGFTPNDTLLITGNWTNTGPIIVINDGVLIFDNATVIDTGDIYLLQDGKLIADSSSLTFPQQYMYQRSLFAVQNSFVQMQNCSLNYSGMSHNLLISDSAEVNLINIHQNDWTTCGVFSKPTLYINGCNLAGEYILIDSSSSTFVNADSLLLWHHIPMGGNINYNFPNGSNVNNYDFNNSVSGINGIQYNVSADTCTNVMWALMPENGTNVTISNSTLRAIGAWFRYNDTANVSGLYNNSNYTNFTAPLTDRNLQLVNTSLQTWSLYVFDSSAIYLDSCQVGEVGTQQHANVTQTTPFLLDGSGGYYWATDSSGIISFGATIYTYARSERNGIFILAYGWQPFAPPQAIGSSLLISVQSETTGDPQMFEAATVWMDKIDGPDTSYTNYVVPVVGSAWIDWAPNGTGWIDFANYSLYYQLMGDTNWINIVKDSLIELHHSTLANWNTQGLTTGNYLLKLTVKNIYGDSVEAIRPITLLLPTQINATHTINNVRLIPNPATENISLYIQDHEGCAAEIFNINGQKIFSQMLHSGNDQLNIASLANGVYQCRIIKGGRIIWTSRFAKM